MANHGVSIRKVVHPVIKVGQPLKLNKEQLHDMLSRMVKQFGLCDPRTVKVSQLLDVLILEEQGRLT